MRKKNKNEPESKTPLEKDVEAIMGPTLDKAGPTDNTKQSSDEEDDNPPERLLVIPDSDQPAEAPNETAQADESESLPEVDDQATDKAVDDIARHDSDELLAVQDAADKPAEPPDKGHKLRRFFHAWWHNKVARWSTITFIIAGIAAAGAFPASRYFILNTAGVRASASLKIIDDNTLLPLKNVQVSVGGQTAATDKAGQVTLHQLKLGKTDLTIKKPAFAAVTKPVTLGWGSNPLGSVSLHAVGSIYTFQVQDFLSGKPIEGAEATSGEASALSDKDGKIVLVVDNQQANQLNVTIKADSFRDENLTLNVATTESQTVPMVPARKHTFISKRSGTYDVYKIDADGKNEAVLLKGTGLERDDISLVPHPSDDKVALVSTRDNVHNKDGFLLSTLTLIDVSDDTATKVAQSEKIQILGWIDTHLIFVQIAAGASANNPRRQRLVSYDYKNHTSTDISAANSFNDLAVIGSSIYYAPAVQLQSDPINFIKSNAAGSSKQTVLNKEVWNIYRTDYDQLTLSGEQDWFSYHLGDAKAQSLASPPANVKNRLYTDSPDARRSAWVDTRDGKGVLLVYDVGTKKDKVVETMEGLTTPVRWLTNNTIVFRVHTAQETADYVLNIDGGKARKIRDVTDAKGIDRWFYY